MQGKPCQLYTAIACSFGVMLLGSLEVWPSYTSSLYASPDTPLSVPMTKGEVALLGSLPSLGALVGTAVAGSIINLLGKRNGGVALTMPYVISWAVIGISSTPKVVLAARFLAGLSCGGFIIYAPVFISEIAEDSIRGTLASIPALFFSAGAFVSYLFGWFMTYQVIIWTNLALSVICILLITFVTESPLYLIQQKQDEDVRAAIAQYRGVSPTSIFVTTELSRLQRKMPAEELKSFDRDMEKQEEEAEKEVLHSEDIAPVEQKAMSPFKYLFTSTSSRRALIMMLTVTTLQLFMGLIPVQVYAKSVFIKTDPTRSDMYSVIFASTMLCGTLLTTSITDKAGRRILLITSSLLVCLFLAILGYLLQSRVAPSWVTLVVILAYCFAFKFGAGPVPWVLLAEVFAPKVQNIASMLIVEWLWLLNFFIIGVFPYVISFMGMHGAFYAFACFGAANAITCFFIVPETKGLSNEQIQETFLRKKH